MEVEQAHAARSAETARHAAGRGVTLPAASAHVLECNMTQLESAQGYPSDTDDDMPEDPVPEPASPRQQLVRTFVADIRVQLDKGAPGVDIAHALHMGANPYDAEFLRAAMFLPRKMTQPPPDYAVHVSTRKSVMPLKREFEEQFCLRQPIRDEPVCVNGATCEGHFIENAAQRLACVAFLTPRQRARHQETGAWETWDPYAHVWKPFQPMMCLMCLRAVALCGHHTALARNQLVRSTVPVQLVCNEVNVPGEYVLDYDEVVMSPRAPDGRYHYTGLPYPIARHARSKYRQVVRGGVVYFEQLHRRCTGDSPMMLTDRRATELVRREMQESLERNLPSVPAEPSIEELTRVNAALRHVAPAADF